MNQPPRSQPTAYWIRLPDGTEYGPGSIALMAQWAAEGRVPNSALLVTRDGAPGVSVLQHPDIAAVLAGKAAPPNLTPSTTDNVLSVIVPYRNQPALFAYYVGIFALIPAAGLLLGPAAIVLGVFGVKLAASRKSVHGTAHAWVGIALGTIATLLNFTAIIALIWGWLK